MHTSEWHTTHSNRLVVHAGESSITPVWKQQVTVL